MDRFRRSIVNALARAEAAGASSTWVLSNHDLVRHASRFGLPDGTDRIAWQMTHGATPVEDRALGLARARAGTLLILALPGSAYLYQGEELGLPEVADLPFDVLEDPVWLRSGHTDKGRDGARVPLPWTNSGPSFGFGAGPAHLPQPAWFSTLSVEAQEADAASTLALYRRALTTRARVLAGEGVRLEESPPHVIEVVREGGWRSITTFGAPTVLPEGDVLVSSAAIGTDRALPADSTAWMRDPG